DPNLVAFGDRFFLYPTTDGSDGWAADSFRAFSSADLRVWTDHGPIFSVANDTVWATGHAWAPAAVERNGHFYLYYTAEGNIGVAKGDDPLGPFTDLGRPLVKGNVYPGQTIDPSLFADDDGVVYLLWGNEAAHVVPLNDDMMSFDRDLVTSFVPTGFREAAWIHKRAGIYYLSWSENDTREAGYRVRYATGSSPVGPWRDQGVLVEKRTELGILATGHHSITQVPGTDTWLIAYHRFAIPDGNGYRREIVIDELHHEAGGLLRPVSPTRVQADLTGLFPAPSATLPPPRTER
ncbi:MAG: beta-xylosidase, partial [Frondihabitans sp.]|nr:beta-xylosidase [Frondihabitans sp.]